MSENSDKIVLSSEKYPGNSDRSKGEDKPERVKKKAVVAATRKRSFSKRFKDTFLNENSATGEVGSYIIYDVIVPAAKTTIADLIEGAIEMILFGNENPRRSRRHVSRQGGRSYVSYNSMYDRDDRKGRTGGRPHNVEPARRARHDFSDVILNSRAEAEIVLSELVEAVDEYGMASVADFYDLVGLTHDYTDQKYGWFELAGAGTVRTREGWVLDLPRPGVIE